VATSSIAAPECLLDIKICTPLFRIVSWAFWSQKIPLSKDGYHLDKQYILVNGRILIYLSRVSFQLLTVCIASDNDVENRAYLFKYYYFFVEVTD
jgi:hypothetical protein